MPMPSDAYVYQPHTLFGTYREAAQALSEQIKNPMVMDWPSPVSAETAAEVAQSLSSLRVNVRALDSDPSGYAEYLKAADYGRSCPDYYRDNFPEKSFEHFVAISLLNLSSQD